MPSRNTVKIYANDHVYHLYNRGVEKRDIFLDDLDYRVFLQQCKLLLSPELEDSAHLTTIRPRRMNLDGQVELIAYCLMPNHFHLILRQLSEGGITSFARSALTSYVGYFNKKYERVGGLFQGVLRAATVDTDAYLVHLSRYIHLNPSVLGVDTYRYPYSSYRYFIETANCPTWLKPEPVLSLFESDTYRAFVEDTSLSSVEILEDVAIDREPL